MSLFGDDDDSFGGKPAKAAKPSSSLFDDGATPASKSTSSLFADDDGDADDSRWGMPTPKKGSRADQVKNLLPEGAVPETYIDAFDAILDDGERMGGNVSADGIQKLLQGSNLSAGEQTRLLTLVSPGGAHARSGLGRSEFNVLLALIGLAQEGDEATLDSVDERRKSLPTPTLAYVDKLKAGTDAPPEARSTKPSPETPTKPRAVRHDSLTSPETDPWASPTTTRAAEGRRAGLGSYANPPPRNMATDRPAHDQNTRTTSNFTTSDTSPEQAASTGGDGTISSGGWGLEDPAASAGFAGSESNIGAGFGDATSPLAPPSRPVGGLGAGTGIQEHITVAVLPEKEGMFMFQHRNYEVKSVRRGSAVVRRYSDFVWLLDCLHKRYPFRQLPLLPPKTLAVNGRHLSSDTAFIEKRRRGLVRFINSLARHPVLRDEQLVTMFLTVPTELAVWRKQATISVQEEFAGKTLPPGLEDSLPRDLLDTFETVRAGVARSSDAYIAMSALLERLSKRKRGVAADSLRLSQELRVASEDTAATYAIDTNDVPLLNEGLNATAKHLETSHSLLEDEARAWDEGVLEDFKRQRDCLVSVREMFERHDRFAKDNIPQLERRIEANESKLQQIRGRSEGTSKPGEAEKVEQAIVNDKQSIVQQHARGVFIQECIREELLTFQASQYQISRLHQDWSQERVKYAELQADNWRALADETENMPLGD